MSGILLCLILVLCWPQENVLVDSEGRAALCDTKYKTIVRTDPLAEHVFIDSSCRWTSPEMLIGDTVSDVAQGPSKEADIYASAMTIVQARTHFHEPIPSLTITPPSI